MSDTLFAEASTAIAPSIIAGIAPDISTDDDKLRRPDAVSAQLGPKPPTLELTGNPTCDHCGQPFTRRAGSGGKPQRFCGAECRKAHNAGATTQRTPTASKSTSAEPKQRPAAVRTSGAPYQCSIPHQLAIHLREVADGGIEITQEDSRGDEVSRIDVSAQNAVALARLILFTAGFVAINISTYDGGWIDISDGDLAENFYKG